MDVLDELEATRRKEIGKWLAADRRQELLAAARGYAAFIATQHGTVTSDDVAQLMHLNSMDYGELGNAAGSVFDGRFEWTGQVVSSKRPASHGRLIRVWRLA